MTTRNRPGGGTDERGGVGGREGVGGKGGWGMCGRRTRGKWTVLGKRTEGPHLRGGGVEAEAPEPTLPVSPLG